MVTNEDGRSGVKLETSLKFKEYQILTDASKVRHNVPEQLAEGEFEEFRVVQDREVGSDFDMELKRCRKVTIEGCKE